MSPEDEYVKRSDFSKWWAMTLVNVHESSGEIKEPHRDTRVYRTCSVICPESR